jgi:hypothetical protein
MSDGQLAMNTNLVSPGLFFKDSNGDLVKTGPVHVGTTAPNATPASGGQAGNSKGELWLDTSGSDYTLKTWDGSAWREIVVTSAMIKDGAIVNADINASAAIAHTKLANITAGSVLLGNASNVPTATALSGDVTVSDAGVTAIGSGVIVDADIDASAAIAGTKVSPDFGSQNVVTTGDLQGASINGGPLAGFRNAIINGNFDIWQRGTSVADFGFVTADRWTTRNQVNTGGSLTQSRQPFTLGQTDVPNEPEYYWRLVFTGSTAMPYVEQRIEGARSFAGQTVTISFWAKRSSASSTCFVEINQYFGTGGSPSTPVTTSSTTFTVGTAWTYITQTFSVPSIFGKTLGTDDNDYLLFRIWLGGTGSFTFELAQVQVEPGPVATPFERRPIGTELALCQRYYFSIEGNLTGGVGYKYADAAVGNMFNGSVTFPSQMRTAPNLTWDSPSFTNSTEGDHVIGQSGATLRADVTAAGIYRIFGGTLIFDAEL